MNSSGIKRGLAVSAVSAMAVAGLPFLASSASATTVDSTLTAGAVELYSPSATAFVSTKNDGTNTTVSLTAGGASNVTSVLFQYQATSTGTTWNDVPSGLVARNADGVFAVDWANPPADLSAIQAVGSSGNTDDQTVTLTSAAQAATTSTVELATEGNLGVFISPYNTADDADGNAVGDAITGQYIGVHGTTSGDSTAVTISQVSHEGQTNTDSVSTTATDADGDGAGTTGAFSAIMDITGYVASTGSDPNQLVLGAATTGATQNTDDAEGSTLRNQAITTVTATPETQNAPASGGKVVVKVTDQFGQPVANAQVGQFVPDGPDAGTDPDVDALIGYTDANGEIEVTQTREGAVTYFANTTDTDAYQAGTDPADSATVTIYTPKVDKVVIKSRADRTSFDLDEIGEADGDDFTITTLDQNGKAFDEDGNATSNDLTSDSEVEYRWVIDPDAAGAPTLTEDWQINAVDTGSTFTVPALVDADLATKFGTPAPAATDLPAGTYTLEARRPNVGLGGGLVNATPVAYTIGESEVTFTDGTSATATAGGSTTITGKLALTGTQSAGLAGRAVPLVYTQGGGNATFAPQAQQPAGVTVTDGTHATVVTGADGTFSVKMNDVPFPANVTPTGETGSLDAGPAQETATDADSLLGTNGADDAAVPTADAKATLAVNWRVAPEVGRIAITTSTLNPYDGANASSAATPGPGMPVDFDVTVYAKDNDTNAANDVAIEDYPVDFSVDKGFLSPNAENANTAVLDDAHKAQGSLWGFFKNDGTSKQASTGDDPDGGGILAPQAGQVVAIERNADFDDDGLATVTVTVKAGAVTETRTVTFDSGALINTADMSLERAAGEPAGDVKVGDEVGFNLYVHDQFGNLVGGQTASITDDSAVASVSTDGDFGLTQTDFTTSNVGILATSDEPTTQTLMAQGSYGQVLVSATGTPDPGAKTVTDSSDPISWVAGKVDPRLNVTGKGARVDRIKANAISKAAGAKATLWVKGKKVKAGVLNENGNITFRVKDKNGRKATRYVVKIGGTALTFSDRDVTRVR